VNVAYRWFLGLKLRDKVPDASTLSQNRGRRFSASTIYQEIFDEIVLLAVNKGLASGTVLYTDSTHLKANANKNRYDLAEVQLKPQEYLQALDAAVTEDRAAHGKRPLKEPSETEPETRQIKVSRTDPESGYMVRDGKPKGFFYLDHRTVDGRHAIITDTHVTPANVHDSVPYLGRLDRQRERFGFAIRAVGVDAGYAAAAITQGLEERSIYGVIGYRTPTHRDGYFYKREYGYDEKLDVYICPNGQLLSYRTTNREGYRQYHSDPAQCRNCPVRHKQLRRRQTTARPPLRQDARSDSCAATMPVGRRRAEHQENRSAAEQNGAQYAPVAAPGACFRIQRPTPPLPATGNCKQRLKLKIRSKK
jgi:IS5 family transposase